MNNFRELNVWSKAVDLATIVYKNTKQFPKSELYGLTSQVRRCSVSIGSNIAEGAGRESKKDFKHFLNISTGSCYELETQLTIAKNLKFLDKDAYNEMKNSVIEIQKMLFSLIKTLK